MKIVIDARMYGTEYTGIGRYVKNLVENLQKADKENKYVLLLRKKYYQKLRLSSNFEKKLVDISHYSLSEQYKLPMVLRSLSPDLVHFPHFNLPVLYRGNFVVTIHDVIMSKQKGKKATTRNIYFNRLKRVAYSKVFSHAIKASKTILVPSQYSKNELIRSSAISGSKIKVIYEGVDANVKPDKNALSEYQKTFDKILKNDFFVYSGNAYPHKNVRRLVEALKYLNDEIKEPVKLLVITPKSVFRKRLKDYASKIGARKYLEFTRFLRDDELGFLYSKSRAFVFPSTEEGFGLPGLEAISNKTILLASDIKVFREVYKDAAIYFNPFDFSSIQKAMFDCLNLTTEKRQERIKQSYELLKDYSLEKMAQETIKVYKKAVL